MAIKILSVLFALIAIRRVVVRYRRGGTLTVEFALWMFVFSGIGVVVFIPHVTDRFAERIGVSSGFNALTFLAISGLLFAVYRLLSRLQTVERDITKLVRTQALAAAARVPPGPPPTPTLPPPTPSSPGVPTPSSSSPPAK
ncbi:MAG: hypothetical protein JWN44_3535 [Myxococcales bacterium]|nr:hypothetical protein [Myxococcales bacterium]